MSIKIFIADLGFIISIALEHNHRGTTFSWIKPELLFMMD